MKMNVREKNYWTDSLLPTGIEFGVYTFVVLMLAGRLGTLREIGLYLPPFLWLIRSALLKRFDLNWRDPLFLALALLSLFALVSSVMSASLPAALHFFKKEYLKLLLLYLVLSTAFADPEKLRKLSLIMALTGVAFLLSGFWRISSSLVLEGSIDYNETRYYATVFMYFIPFIILRTAAGNRRTRGLWMLPLAFAIGGIVIIGVRGSWLALFVVLLIWAAAFFKFRARQAAVFLKRGVPVVALLVLTVLVIFPSQFDLLRERVGVRSPVSDRLEAWGHYLKVSMESPLLGHGLDDEAMVANYRESYKAATGAYPSEQKPVTPHNQYIRVLYQQGIIGLSLYLLLLGMLLYRVVRTSLEHGPGDFSLIGIAIVSAVAGEYIVRCLTEVRSLVPLGILIGMAGAFLTAGKRKESL